MRISQAPLTMLIFLIIMFGLSLVYYRGLVANVHAVGGAADNLIATLQLRPDTYATGR